MAVSHIQAGSWAKSTFYNIKICSWNVRGLQKPAKTAAVLSFLKRENVSIELLQETHLVCATLYSSFISGVATLISKNLTFECIYCIKENQGHFIIIKGILAGKEVTSMNLYCPPAFSLDFVSKTFAVFMGRASGSAVDKHPSDTSTHTQQAR